jgi:uncharacterized surface anchored protein
VLHRVLALGLCAAAESCGGQSSVAEPTTTSSDETSEPRTETTSAEAVEATSEATTSSDAPIDEGPWRVELAANEGVWGMASLAPRAPNEGAIALYTHAELRQRGYDPMGTAHFVEVRNRAFGLRWRRIERGP